MKRRTHLTFYFAVPALIIAVGLGAYFAVDGFFANPRDGTSNAARAVAIQARAAPDSSEGPPAPDFALERLNGEMFRLSDHRGKVVAINFWATWCPPCREEIPDLIDVQKKMKGEVLFVGVALDKGSPEKVRAFAEEFGINYPIIIDDGRVVEKYGPILGIPTTFFVSPNGHVPVKAVGLLTRENLRPVLKALIEGGELEHLKPPFRRIRHPFGIKR